MNASAYFTPGPNGEPAMFGPGGFAEAWTPKREGCDENAWLVFLRSTSSVVWFGDFGTNTTDRMISNQCALALCEQAAQKYINDQGYGFEHTPERLLYCSHYTRFSEDPVTIEPVDGRCNWLELSKWVARKVGSRKVITKKVY